MTDSDQILIDRYLSGAMSTAEKGAFELRLQSDSDLKSTLIEYENVHAMLRDAGRLDLKDTLEGFEDQSPTKKIVPLWIKRVVPLAAVFVLFLGTYQYFWSQKTMTGVEAYDKHFELYEAPSALRDMDAAGLVNWKKALSAYENENYEQAIELFSIAEMEIPDYLKNYYIGLSEMAKTAPDFEKAIQNFDTVLKTDNDYNQQAQWYRGLAHLRVEAFDDAMEAFQHIVENKSYKYQSAEKLLSLKIKK